MTLTIDHAIRSYWALRKNAILEVKEFLKYRRNRRMQCYAKLSLTSAKGFGESIRALRAGIETECPELFRGPQTQLADGPSALQETAA